MCFKLSPQPSPPRRRLVEDLHPPMVETGDNRKVLVSSLKERARYEVHKALRTGTLTRPLLCEQCGIEPGRTRHGHTKLHAHHPNYHDPLGVEWLCSTCHLKRHELGVLGGRASGKINGARKTEDQIRAMGRLGGKAFAEKARLSGFKTLHQTGVCPHCGREMRLSLLKRRHSSNCKHRK